MPEAVEGSVCEELAQRAMAIADSDAGSMHLSAVSRQSWHDGGQYHAHVRAVLPTSATRKCKGASLRHRLPASLRLAFSTVPARFKLGDRLVAARL